jgi:hypothetical protein
MVFVHTESTTITSDYRRSDHDSWDGSTIEEREKDVEDGSKAERKEGKEAAEGPDS